MATKAVLISDVNWKQFYLYSVVRPKATRLGLTPREASWVLRNLFLSLRVTVSLSFGLKRIRTKVESSEYGELTNSRIKKPKAPFGWRMENKKDGNDSNSS